MTLSAQVSLPRNMQYSVSDTDNVPGEASHSQNSVGEF